MVDYKAHMESICTEFHRQLCRFRIRMCLNIGLIWLDIHMLIKGNFIEAINPAIALHFAFELADYFFKVTSNVTHYF